MARKTCFMDKKSVVKNMDPHRNEKSRGFRICGLKKQKKGNSIMLHSFKKFIPQQVFNL